MAVLEIRAKCLNGYARADLPVEFEAVGDGLRRAVDADVNILHSVIPDDAGERIAGDAGDAKRGIAQRRRPSTAGESDVHLVRDLRRELVNGQRGEEGDPRVGRASDDCRMGHP